MEKKNLILKGNSIFINDIYKCKWANRLKLGLIFGLIGLISACNAYRVDGGAQKNSEQVSTSAKEQQPVTPVLTLKEKLAKKWQEEGGQAQLLNPVIVPASAKDASLPEANALGKNQEKVFSQDTVVFKNVAKLYEKERNVKDYFLIWNSGSLGTPVEDAYYVHELVDNTNKKSHTFERKNVYQDKDGERWFIPLSQLLDGSIFNADPSFSHWITLELHLPESIVVNLKVNFQVLGPLPDMNPANLASDADPELTLVGKNLTSGWVLEKKMFQNNSQRKFNLAIKGSMAKEGVSFCKVPSAKELVFKWTVTQTINPPINVPPVFRLFAGLPPTAMAPLQINDDRSTTRTETWQLVGAKWWGKLDNKVTLLDPATMNVDSQEPEEGIKILFEEQNNTIVRSSGDMSDLGAIPFECQGYF
ncbi:MAG: hypothetical protein HY072_02820 [Deltaproteobacteria bacterium]|nr:hypothetical protein [Deltaproteobacteria bacterium]